MTDNIYYYKHMKRDYLIWGVPALIYAVFFVWYTNLTGSLTDKEIAFYMEKVEAQNQNPEQRAQLRRFMEEDQGDDFHMINLIDMKAKPDPVEGVAPDESAQQVLDRYMEFMWPELLKRASHPSIAGSAISHALDVEGVENAQIWTQGALMRYRSRRDLIEIATNPAFQGRHIFKIAAMQKTIAVPIETSLNSGDPRFILALVLLLISTLLHTFLPRSRG